MVGITSNRYDRQVKIVQKWNGGKPSITREFLEDFRTHLEQKITDQENSNNNYNNYRYKNYNNSNNLHNYSNNNHCIEWIEKVLLYPVEDYRKTIVNLVLAPYLILVKKLSFEESFQIINRWLKKCNLLKKLDFNTRYFINTALATTCKKQIFPMEISTLKTSYKDLYLLLEQKGKEDQLL